MRMDKLTCCFTGHRPKNLPWGYNKDDIRWFKLQNIIMKEIEKLVDEGYTHFISGMAQGIDIWCAKVVLNLKKDHPEITLECAVPCRSQSKKWPDEDKYEYYYILKNADKVTLISDKYTKTCMQDRNKYMVDNSDLVLAVYDKTQDKSGTAQTIRYAKEKNKKLFVMNLNFRKDN